MASLTLTLPSVNNANLSSTSTIASLPILKKKSLPSKHGKPNHYYASRVACKAANDDKKNPISSQDEQEEAHLGMFDRRNILLGIGGLYGAASTLSNNPFALALADGSTPKPIPPPELGSCHIPTGLPEWAKVETCCPPVPPDPSKIITFSEHLKNTDNTKLRIRPPAHTVAKDSDYLRKLEKAIQAMKDLDRNDPRNFSQQANVHCAYCNGGYPQLPCGSSDNALQVHFSWIFFPFHRWYLYFYEKILGKLIGDPYFAMPFWNWDHRDGMYMPRIYTDDVRSPLFDRFRNMNHLAPTVVDLNYSRGIDDIPNKDAERYNLKIMYRQMVLANTPELFFGQCYHAGSKSSKSGMGSIENFPHNTVHTWVGDPQMPNHEDMGNFYSAGNDPIFFAHHSNVDRLWSVWKQLDGKSRKDFTCKDWLDTGFVFYDENKIPVKVTVKECLDTKKLGYDYEKVENVWVLPDYRPTARLPYKKLNVKPPTAPTIEETRFPVILDSVKKFYVARPDRKPAADENVILLIEGIEFLNSESVKFDVLLNDEDDASSTPDYTEFAASFANVSHGNANELIKSSLKTNITEILKDLQVSDDEKTVLVTLVPKYAGNKVSVGGIKIQLDKATTELTCL